MIEPVETYTLEHPLPVTIKDSGGERTETIKTVNFRKPLTGDLVAMDKASGDTEATLRFVSHISDISYAQLQKLEIVDGRALMKIASGFLSNGPSRPETSQANS